MWPKNDPRIAHRQAKIEAIVALLERKPGLVLGEIQSELGLEVCPSYLLHHAMKQGLVFRTPKTRVINGNAYAYYASAEAKAKAGAA